jgi:hypothetical protein
MLRQSVLVVAETGEAPPARFLAHFAAGRAVPRPFFALPRSFIRMRRTAGRVACERFCQRLESRDDIGSGLAMGPRDSFFAMY